LQELRRQQQDMYGQQVNALLMQIREAQEQVAQAAELRRKAEEKCTTARKFNGRSQMCAAAVGFP
jgi:hypothetical protein